MTKLDKRIRKLEQGPRSVSSEELITILVALGFEHRGGKGSQQCYQHPLLPHIKLTIPKQNPLLQGYVKQALKVIHELRELIGDD